jgi:uncharacterized protein YbjT (DUF2867 family)
VLRLDTDLRDDAGLGMDVLIYGATGMVGQGVLRESLAAADVTRVVTLGRSGTGIVHPKLTEIVHPDLHDLRTIEPQLRGLDACFFCLGVTSSGMSETNYSRITYELTVAAGETLARLNPKMTFVFVSGAGTDSTEAGRVMWARVKGRAENALLRMPFRAVYCFRPGFIQPLDGITSRTKAYRFFYAILGPLLTPMRKVFPRSILTTRSIGQAMLNAVRRGAPKPILESADIAALAR